MKVWSFIIVFLAGIIIGAAGMYFAPDYLDRYMPGIFNKSSVVVKGEVVAKEKKAQDLLVTVNTDEGAILVTFKKKVPEIELLVQVGDTLELRLKKYSPFVVDPVIERVVKGERGAYKGAEGRSEMKTKKENETLEVLPSVKGQSSTAVQENVPSGQQPGEDVKDKGNTDEQTSSVGEGR